jgi:hypothetical protein
MKSGVLIGKRRAAEAEGNFTSCVFGLSSGQIVNPIRRFTVFVLAKRTFAPAPPPCSPLDRSSKQAKLTPSIWHAVCAEDAVAPLESGPPLIRYGHRSRVVPANRSVPLDQGE